MIDSGFRFVASNLHVEGELPIEVSPGLTFRRAQELEIEMIKKVLTDGIPLQEWGARLPYDSNVLEDRQDNKASYRYEDLPKAEWRYFVVAFEGNNRDAHDITVPSLLLTPEVEFGFDAGFDVPNQSGKRIMWSHVPVFISAKYFDLRYATENALPISTETLAQIGEYKRLQSELDSRYTFIEHSLKIFSSLRRVEESSDLLIVGYFSIIEALVTHPPRLNESLDSISHQIRTKLVLLSKKYKTPIDPNRYFASTSDEQLWKVLYQYRSDIAHGGIPHFESKLKVLKSRKNVLGFLKETAKQLLISGLLDPEFLDDIKRC